MLVILLNGLLYNFLGIPPVLKRLSSGMWYIYHASGRLAEDIERSGLVVLQRETLTRWRTRPILFQWTVQKPQVTGSGGARSPSHED